MKEATASDETGNTRTRILPHPSNSLRYHILLRKASRLDLVCCGRTGIDVHPGTVGP